MKAFGKLLLITLIALGSMVGCRHAIQPPAPPGAPHPPAVPVP